MRRAVFFVGLLVAMVVGVFAQELPRLAVVEFATNMDNTKTKADAIAIRNFVQSNLVSSGKYDVMTRDQIDKLIENQRIQISSISSAENRKKLELAQINYIVTGTVDAIDNDYGVTISMLDVSTGKFSHSTSQFMSNTSADIYNKTATLVSNFQKGMSNEGENVVQTGHAGSNKQYFVGDEGPAGGIVFFDRGFYGDGWRYLEAAPAGSEVKGITWGGYRGKGYSPSEHYIIANTMTAVGFGKQNTQIIIARLQQLGESNRAAQVCANMDINGFKDWFLPSRDELGLMYNNLTEKGLGSFSNDRYWSSSQTNDVDGAYGRWFGSGREDYFSNKFLTGTVRAIRQF